MYNEQFINRINNIFNIFVKDLREMELEEEGWKIENDLNIFLNRMVNEYNKFNDIDKNNVIKDLKNEVIKNILFNEHQIIVKEFLKSCFFQLDNIFIEYVKTTTQEDKKIFLEEIKEEKGFYEKAIDKLSDKFNDLTAAVVFQLLNCPNSLETDEFTGIIHAIHRMEEIKEEKENLLREINKIIDQINEIEGV